MDFLLFLVIFGIALSSAWLYTTINQLEDLPHRSVIMTDEPCPYCDEEPCICDYLYESRRDIEYDGF